MTPKGTYVLDANRLNDLISLLRDEGYEVIGPKKLDFAVSYEPISSVDEMPVGYIDVTKPGFYRLEKWDKPVFFGTLHSSCSWKKYLYPIEVKLFTAKRENGSFKVEPGTYEVKKKAFLGVRPCDLSAIKVMDKVLMGGPFVDDLYKANRENTLIIGVNCTRSGETCFCNSLGTGPELGEGYDIGLTEITEGDHRFIVRVLTDKGMEIISKMNLKEATDSDLEAERKAIDNAISTQTRKVYTEGIKEILYSNMEAPYWEELDKRCLGCGNCTMVCPTCFCTTVYDYTSFTGDEAWRVRLIDSCFTLAYSYIHGGSIRKERKFTYRHWLTHKYATWQDQFGTLGCVGCGRCITWCPVGIAINDEVNHFAGVKA